MVLRSYNSASKVVTLVHKYNVGKAKLGDIAWYYGNDLHLANEAVRLVNKYSSVFRSDKVKAAYWVGK